jgi:hypothetical protein
MEKNNNAKELVTMDGKTMKADGWECVFMTLAGMTEAQLLDIGGEAAVQMFVELTDNFILSNTKEHVDKYLAHTVMLKFCEFINDKR